MSDAVIIDRQGQFKRVPGRVDDIECMQATAMLINIVKDAGEALERHYPQWWWELRPDERGGVVDIFARRISGRYAYTLHIPTIEADPLRRCVVTAGGEYLERFGFRRVPYSYAEWRRREIVLGQFIPDVTDMQMATQRNVRTTILKHAIASGHARVATNPSISAALASSGRT